MEFFGIYWAGIERIIFAPLFIFFIGIVFFRLRQQRKIIAQLVHYKNRALYLQNFSFKKQYSKALFLSLGIIALFLAFLQPQWGKKEQQIIQESRDLLILLDVSRSMLVSDCKPNRLAFAKSKIRALLDRLPVDRIGLILFSSTAFVQCPLTLDHGAVFTFLNQITPESISMGSTSLDAPLNEALQVFNRIEGRSHKLALLITDGEDFSLQLSSAQEKAIKENLTLFALGIGTAGGGPIPILDARGTIVGHERLANGSIALSKLNEKKLQELCAQLHGKTFIADNSDKDIEEIASLVEQFNKETVVDKQITHYEEQYPWLVGLALIFLALEWII